jgi:hypothetical protein
MIKLSRIWAMPNKNTFSIKAIKQIIEKEKKEKKTNSISKELCQ